MAAPLNWTGTVTTETGDEYLNAQLIVSANRATLRRGRELVAERPDVVSVTPVHGTRNTRLVTFSDGTVWTVVRRSGCGCR